MGEWRYSSTFLNFALDGGEWLASCLCRFTAGERAPSTHCIGDWVSHRISLDAMEDRKIFQCLELNLGLPAHSLLLYRLSYSYSSLYCVDHCKP
jgi:hypothetical protein